MFKWTFVIATIVLTLFVAIGCSGGGGGSPATPSTNPDLTSGPGQTGQAQNPNTSLLGYYDIYFDVESQTMQVVEDRTASFTMNIIPLLIQMTSPPKGLAIGSLVIDNTYPENLMVEVELKWYHPFPTMDQFKIYDYMGVIISNGDSTLMYHNLRVGNYGTDTYMTNADGYTRWFNPSEFTTEGVLGWAPGGCQNYKGNAKVNPYKAYGKGLSVNGSLWDWLEGGSNNDGVFKSGAGRRMKLEFPSPPPGDGLVFGFAMVCCWENQGSGPYSPYHRKEPIAFRVDVENDIYYDGSVSDGNLIADIDVWAWGAQPSTVLIESTVLSGIEVAAPTGGGGANWSTYSIDVPAAPITSIDGHELWVIAVCDDYNYINIPGVPAPPGTQPLAAFYRVPLYIGTELNVCPVIDDVYDDVMGPGGGILGIVPSGFGYITYTADSHDDNNDTLTTTWYVTADGVALDTSTDAVPDGSIGWYADIGHGQWDLYVGVDDGGCEVFSGPYDVCANDAGGTIYIAGNGAPGLDSIKAYNVHAFFEPDGDTLSWEWAVTDGSTGDPVTSGVTDYEDGSIEIDWAAVGASDKDEYIIDCNITDMCETIPAAPKTVTTHVLFNEHFDTDPADWAYDEFIWEDWCSPYPGDPAWTNIGPDGPSGPGNIRYPAFGNSFSGGFMGTIVTPPFDVPDGASAVYLRVYASMGIGGSSVCYHSANWKIVESSTPGIAPFVSGNPASLPPGGAYLQNSLTHGSTGWGTYLFNPNYCSPDTPLYWQRGWEVDHGGGAFPGSLVHYLDLKIPSNFYGLTVKACFQFQPDRCGYAGSGVGIALDDFELMTY
jgi:hypothetical protein